MVMAIILPRQKCKLCGFPPARLCGFVGSRRLRQRKQKLQIKSASHLTNAGKAIMLGDMQILFFKKV